MNRVNIPKGVSITEISELPNTTISGGDLINVPGGICTAGFIVRNTANTLGVASAHHCGGGQTWNGNALGQFRSIPSRDTAWVELPANVAALAQNRVRTGPNTFREITGTQVVNPGTSICMFGNTSGFQCGIVVSNNVNTTYATGQSVANLIHATRNGQPGGGGFLQGGDSGGPMFVGNNAAGTNAATTANDSYFAPIANTTAMAVNVLTQ